MALVGTRIMTFVPGMNPYGRSCTENKRKKGGQKVVRDCQPQVQHLNMCVYMYIKFDDIFTMIYFLFCIKYKNICAQCSHKHSLNFGVNLSVKAPLDPTGL